MRRYAGTFHALRALFEPYAARLTVSSDSETTYMLDGAFVDAFDRPMSFGGVRDARTHVNVYLTPVFSNPELMGRISDALRVRLTGKSCFSFTTLEPALLLEVRDLIARGFALYETLGYIK